MEKSKVYFTDFRATLGEGMPTKLKRLIKKAGIGQIDMDGKFVAIKMNFGELGNLGFLRPNYARAVVDVVKELGGKPFLTDCNTMYPGSRKNALEHLYCAWENGFTPLTVGCPVIIGDGLKGTDDIGVPVAGGEYVKEARIGRAIMDADIFISLTHFKGHETTGFGGTIKNIGMGCGSRAGKTTRRSAADAAAASASAPTMVWCSMRRPARCTSIMRIASAAGVVWVRATLTPSPSMNTTPTRCSMRVWRNTPRRLWMGVRTSIFRSSWTFPRTAIAIERMIRRFCRISACLRRLTRLRWIRRAWMPVWRRTRCRTASFPII